MRDDQLDGDKAALARLKDVAAPLVAVGKQPTGARDTRKRSTPGESTARTLVVVVAVLKVGGFARFAVSRPSAWRNEGSAGSTTLVGSAEVRPQVLKAVTADVVDPPDTNAKPPSGANDTALAGAGREIFFKESCVE